VLALSSPAQQPAPSAASEPATAPRDDRRPDRPLSFDLAGTPVQLGGQWEYTDERRTNFDLDGTRARDRRVREHELKLELRALIDERTQAFAQIVGLHETRRTQGNGREVTRTLERGPMWWQRERLFGTPWALQIGRVELLERRAWWWDDDLDAVRLRYRGSPWQLDTGLARELGRSTSGEDGIAPQQRGVLRWFGQASWLWAPRQAVDAFWLVQHDGSSQPTAGQTFADEDATDPSDLGAQWVGVRASGQWRPDNGMRLAYWADAAWLRGRERLTAFQEQAGGGLVAAGTTSNRVRGNAVDVGATLTAPLPLQPSLTAAVARGSEGFRQTGLQENKARFAGVKRWQRYGELLQPELSNLAVTTLAAGVRVLDNTSIEIAAHRYRQVRAADGVRGARLSADPEGTNRSLGREVDLLVAVRESKRVEFHFKASHFKPGAAYAPDRRDSARAVEIGVTVNF
jgi:hypothetical protein